jgi:hypothetical protein
MDELTIRDSVRTLPAPNHLLNPGGILKVPTGWQIGDDRIHEPRRLVEMTLKFGAGDHPESN